MKLIKSFLPSALKNKIRDKIYRFLSNSLELGSQIERYEKFSENAVIPPSVRLLPNAKVENFANNPKLIVIGENSVIIGQLRTFAHGGKIEIGKDCYIGEDTRIWSADSVKICNRVFISHNVNIHDTNSHSVDPNLRYKHFVTIMSSGDPKVNDVDIQSKSIYIEDDVWIGFNSTILKGVTIGRGSIIAACSVVTKSVPPFVIVAGNPARIVKKIEYTLDR